MSCQAELTNQKEDRKPPFQNFIYCGKTQFKINLEYFNIASSKRILFLLYKLNELAEANKEVSVEWHHRENDEDMFEVGQDYAYMVRVPFKFIEFVEADLAIAI